MFFSILLEHFRPLEGEAPAEQQGVMIVTLSRVPRPKMQLGTFGRDVPQQMMTRFGSLTISSDQHRM